MASRLVAILLALAALAGSFVLTGCGQSSPQDGQPRAEVRHTIEDYHTSIDGTNIAIVMFFYTDDSEVAVEHMDTLKRVADRYVGRVKFVMVDCVYESKMSSNAALVTLYDVHNVPTIVLRRKGDVYYRKLVGKFNDSELMSFIDNGLKSEPTAEVEKR